MGILINYLARFAFAAIGMTGTKLGPSRDQAFTSQKHQVGTKSGTKWGPSQTGREWATKGLQTP
jgi:hypothetical protein